MLQVREAAGMTGEAFAEAINAAAVQRGVPGVNYDKSKVSRLEAGSQATLLAEEAAIIAALDREERGVEWLALGTPPVAVAKPEPPRAVQFPLEAGEKPVVTGRTAPTPRASKQASGAKRRRDR